MNELDNMDPEFNRELLTKISMSDPFYFHYQGHKSSSPDDKKTFKALNFFIGAGVLRDKEVLALGSDAQKIFYVSLTKEGHEIMSQF